MGLFDGINLDGAQAQGLFANPQTQGLLAAAAQILQQSGPSLHPTSFGQILGGGLGAYTSGVSAAQARQQQQELQGLKLKGLLGELSDQEQARKQNQAILGAARNAFQAPAQQAPGFGGGPTLDNAERNPETKGGFDTDAFINQMMKINPLEGLKYAQMLKKSGDDFDTTPRTGRDANGNPFQYIISKAGKVQRLDGVLPRDELKLANLGGRDVAYDPYALLPGQTFQRTASPDTLATNAVTMRGQNMVDARAREENALAAGRAPKMTEDQSKATGWLVQAENAYSNLKKVAFDSAGKLSAAATPGWADAVASVPGLGGVGNYARSPDRQKFIQAASSMSEALLRAATGAGVNRDEAQQKVEELTPVWGEDPSVTKQKFDAMPLYIESLKVRAGPGAGQAAEVLAKKPDAGGAGSSQFSVTAPNGKTYHFNSAKALANFKLTMGIK